MRSGPSDTSGYDERSEAVLARAAEFSEAWIPLTQPAPRLLARTRSRGVSIQDLGMRTALRSWHPFRVAGLRPKPGPSGVHVPQPLAIAQLDLSVAGLRPPLHLPLAAGLAQGPGFPNLSCLGLLSDRILRTYVRQEEPAPSAPGRRERV